MRLVIFDLDGTLFRTETVDVEALNRALSINGFQRRSEEEILHLIGPNMDEVCRILIGEPEESKKDKFVSDILQFEKELIETSGKLYEGVEKLLTELYEASCTLCICSNGPEEYVHKVLSRFKLTGFFDEIRPYRPGVSKTQAVAELKEKYGVDCFVMVGDRSGDVEAARNNGGISIGAAYGFGRNEAYAADHVAENPEEIGKIVLSLK